MIVNKLLLLLGLVGFLGINLQASGSRVEGPVAVVVESCLVDSVQILDGFVLKYCVKPAMDGLDYLWLKDILKREKRAEKLGKAFKWEKNNLVKKRQLRAKCLKFLAKNIIPLIPNVKTQDFQSLSSVIKQLEKGLDTAENQSVYNTLHIRYTEALIKAFQKMEKARDAKKKSRKKKSRKKKSRKKKLKSKPSSVINFLLQLEEDFRLNLDDPNSI